MAESFDTSALKRLDTTGLTRTNRNGDTGSFDTSGLTALDTQGLTPVTSRREPEATEQSRPSSAASSFVRGFGGIASGVPKAMALAGAPDPAIIQNLERIDRGEPWQPTTNQAIGPGGMGRMVDPNEPFYLEYEKAEPEQRRQWREELIGAAEGVTETPLYETGRDIDQWFAENFPTNPEYRNEFWSAKVPQALGSATGFVAAGALSRGALRPMGPAASFTAPAVLGSSVNRASQFEDALNEGADIATALQAADIGALVGASEAVPIGNLLNRLDRVSGGTVKRYLGRAIQQGTEEAVQEAFTGIMNDAVAQNLYDPERGVWTTDRAEEAAVGFTTGAILETLMTLALPGRRRGTQGATDQPDPYVVPEGAVPADTLFGEEDQPEGVRESAVRSTPAPTQEDVSSPIPTDIIQEGKASVQDAMGETAANELLREVGFPEVGRTVTLSTRDGGSMGGTVVDAFDQNGQRGAKIRLENGRVVAETFDQLRGRLSEDVTLQGLGRGRESAPETEPGTDEAERWVAAPNRPNQQTGVEYQVAPLTEDTYNRYVRNKGDTSRSLDDYLRIWDESPQDTTTGKPTHVLLSRSEGQGDFDLFSVGPKTDIDEYMGSREREGWFRRVDSFDTPEAQSFRRGEQPTQTQRETGDRQAPAQRDDGRTDTVRDRQGQVIEGSTFDEGSPDLPDQQGYQQRTQERLDRLEQATSSDQVDAIVREHGTDPDGHVEGFTSFESKAKARKSAIDNPPTPGLVDTFGSERSAQGAADRLNANDQGTRHVVRRGQGPFGETFEVIREEDSRQPAVDRQSEMVDESDPTEQTRANLAGESDERAPLIVLRDMLEMGTDSMNDGQFPQSIRRTAVDLSNRITEALDSGGDISAIRDEASEVLDEWLGSNAIEEGARELQAVQQTLEQQRQLSGGDRQAVSRRSIPRREAPDAQDTAVTPNGREVPVRYAVVEAADLVASQTDEGRANEAYPAELQPRDRSRAMSGEQVRKMANDINPRLLDRSPRASDGAPIISDDGVVESGNGRVLALRKAYGQGKGETYRQFLQDKGYPVDGLNQPVLVRVRDGEMSPADRQAFTREANERDTLDMSDTERAMSDASAMTESMMELYRGGEVDQSGNRDFVRAFIEGVVGENERTGMIAADGQMSQKAIRRLQGAIVAKAYGDANLLSALIESTDNNIRAIGGALMDVAPLWAKMRSKASEGFIDPAMDQTARLLEAVQVVQRARRERRSLSEFVGQGDMLSGEAMDPVTEAFLRLMFRNTQNWTQPAGRDKIATALRYYIDAADRAQSGTDLLGDSAPDPARVLSSAKERQYAEEEQAGQQEDLLAQPPGRTERSDRQDESEREGTEQSPETAREPQTARSGEEGTGTELTPTQRALAEGLLRRAREAGNQGAIASLQDLLDGRDPTGGQVFVDAQLYSLSNLIRSTNQSAPDTDTATASAEAPLYIEDYTEKSIIIRGDTKPYKETIKEALPGRKPLWNRKAKGWVFPKARESEVREALSPLLGESRPDQETAPARSTQSSTAPEHANNQGKPLDPDTKYIPTATGASRTMEGTLDESVLSDIESYTITAEQFKEITDEWAAQFENPEKRTVTAHRAKEEPTLTVEQAQARIDEWKEHVREQFENHRGANSNKTVLSLFDLTGEWVRPYVEAGYNVITFDIQSGQDVMDFSAQYFIDNWDFGDVYAILAACPCTDFASSGARHFAAKDADGRTEASKELVFQTMRTIEFFRPQVWALENPAGRIKNLTGLPEARLTFDPNHFGDPYTKKTVLYGNFNPDLPLAPVDPTEGSKMHRLYGGKSQATKNARSATPQGFSYAFFMANNAVDTPAIDALPREYPEASGAIRTALENGVPVERVKEILYETYENFEYEDARTELARATREQIASGPTPPTGGAGGSAAGAGAGVAGEMAALATHTERMRAAGKMTAGDTVSADGRTWIKREDDSWMTQEGIDLAARGEYSGDNHRTDYGIASLFGEPGSDGRARRTVQDSRDTAAGTLPVEDAREQQRLENIRKLEEMDTERAQAPAARQGPEPERSPAVIADRLESLIDSLNVNRNTPAGAAKDDVRTAITRLRGTNPDIDNTIALLERASQRLYRNHAPASEYIDEMIASLQEQTPAPAQPEATERPATYGKANKVFTEDAAEKARETLRKKLNQLNTGLDPEIVQAGITLAGYHIEAGARSFSQYSRAMLADLGEAARPYLRSWYEGVRYYPGFDAEGMSSAAEIETAQSQSVTIEGQEDSVDGIQRPVPIRDAREGAEDVQPPATNRGAEQASSGQEPGSTSDVPDADRGRADAAERVSSGSGGQGSGAAGARDTDRVSVRDTGERGRRPAGDTRAEQVKGTNYRIDPGSLEESRGKMQKARDNIRAIELMRQIEAEGRPATNEEQQQLARYVGWGGLKDAFPDSRGNFGKGMEAIGRQLQELLTDTEYATARRSLQYAHYTAENVVGAMWDAVSRFGFQGGKVFEPGMGVGNFAGLMPADVAAVTDYNGLELDHTTARIARLLYPSWGVRQDDFTRAPLPKDSYDVVIGNPPFADIPIKSDPAYPQGFLIHDYFFAKSLDAVRPGGVLAFVSSAGTMNKLDSAAREYMADQAELVGAIRLPGTAFQQSAGTSVTTDIIFLRKRLPGEEAGSRTWTETVEVTLPGKDGSPVRGNMNRYFSENPDMVLGEQGFFDPLYEGRYAVRAPKDFDLTAALNTALEALPENVMSEWQDTTGRAQMDFGTAERKEGSFYIGRDGRLMQQREGVGRPVEKRGKGVKGGKSQKEVDRIEALVPVRDALRAVYAADLADDTANADTARQRLNDSYDAFVKKFGPINKANFQYRRPTIIQQEVARMEAREEARFEGRPWMEGDFDASSMIEEGATLSLQKIARARADAREAAKKAGKAFDEGSFDPSDMPDIVIEKRPNIDPFMDDPESYRLRSIEKYDDESGQSEKSNVFFENIITKERTPTINSVHDAVLHTLNQKGRLDIREVARLAKISESEAIEKLGESIYRLPGTEDQWVTRDEYLSGNVRRKLRQAKAAAGRDASLMRNVDALEAAQPAPLPPSEINANLGMPWIPTEVISQFATDAMGLDRATVKYTPILGQWDVTGDDSSRAAVSTWGTRDRPAPGLIADALNRQDPRVYVTTWVDGKKTRQLDTVATEAAQEKVREIKQRFSDWVWSDPDRARRLAELYNEDYNNLVVREHNGDYLTTPGISSAWSWREHQKAVIARIIQDGNTYMAHSVGSGKTSAMIGAGMEMRRLGLVRKPMYSVPNHMLGQFTKEFYEQYPTARIAVADERRFHTGRRKQFIADVANEDLDAVIITHSAFGMIPISDEFQDGLVQEQIDQYRKILQDVSEDQESRITRSRLEKQIERLEQRLSGRGQKKRDQVFTFEEMGVDFLFVDEAHLFRKLDFATKMSNVKGISPEGSKASWDLFVKTRYLDTINPSRNLVLASGTPVTNTMAELFTVSRYLQPGELRDRGLEHFDAWAGAFGDTVTNLEQDPSGGYKPVTRFAKFVNVPELSNMVRQNMDVVTSRQLEQYVTRPKLKDGKRKMNLAEKSEALDAYQQSLSTRMEAIAERKGPPKKGDDIILNVINDGRHAAIDMRLVDPSLPSDQGSKLNLLVDNVFRIWNDTKRQAFHRPKSAGVYEDKAFDKGPATQMVFANLGLSGKRGFAVPDYIRSELVRRGVPRDQIALIGDYKSHVAKQRLFNDMNEGKVRVLIGSTSKMATGVNAQRRLYALHNLDPLWYPADDEQRIGRALRQGNMNPEIEVNDYSTKGTYDSTMWGMMETKARFIQGFFEGDPSLRDMEDLGEASQYEQAKAITTADPRLIELTELRQQLERANRRKAGFDREQYATEQTVANAKNRVRHYSERIPAIERDIQRRVDTKGEAFTAKVNGKTYTDRVEVGDLLMGEIDLMTADGKDHDGVKLGEIGGFDIVADVWGQPGKRFASLAISREGGHETEARFSESARGLVQSLENGLRSFESDLADAQNRLKQSEREIAEFEPQIGKEFTGQEEIDRLTAEVRDLERELTPKQEAKPTEDPDDEPGAFSREQGGAVARELPAKQIMDAFLAQMDNAPEGVVVRDMQDERVPEAMRDADAQQRSQGATGAPEGFYFEGKAYLVLDGLTRRQGETGEQAVIRVMSHEVLGHAGLRGYFGKELGPVLREVAMKRRGDVRMKAEKYGLDITAQTERMSAAEEVLADMAQTQPTNSLVTRAVEAIRKALRSLYLRLPRRVKDALGNGKFVQWVNGMSDAEIIDRFIVPARNFIERGRASESDIQQDPVFQRGETDQDQGQAEQQDEGLELETQTDEQIREQESDRQRTAREQEQAEREAEQREQADRERDEFTLTGSDSEADQAAARGQMPLFSRSEDPKKVMDPTAEGGQEARQELANRWYGFQPLDQVMRLPFHVFGGINERGEWNWGRNLSDKTGRILTEAKFSEEGRFTWINPIMEKARAGLIDRYGLSSEYVERERQRGLDERSIMAQVPEIMETLKSAGVGTTEARVLQAVLTGEEVADSDMAKLAEPIRNAIDDMGAEAVQLGLISAESYQRNRGAYLHRVYLKHEVDQGGLARWVSRMANQRRRKIIGNQFKGRGMWVEVNPSQIMRDIPGFTSAERGMPVNGEQFRILDKVQGEGQEALRGIDPASSRKVQRRVFLPADAPVPDNLMGYADRGLWEVRGSKGGKAILWRDFTKPERESMGEIVDARYTIAKTYMQMAHDLATGRFFRDISMNEDWSTGTEPRGTWRDAQDYNRFWGDPSVEWVRVPDTIIPKSQTKRYGALAGRYVRAEIWRDLAELERMQKPGMWDAVLRQWKINKTARSPVVHMNNVMSNAVLMDLADVRLMDLVHGIRSMVRQDSDYQDAVDHGTFGSDMVAQELRKNTLQPILEEIERDLQGNRDTLETKLGVVGKVAGAIWSRTKNLDRKMTNLYQLEDEVFRMATYMRKRALGLEANEAAIEARDQFLNYDIRAPWVNAARRSALPFISYTYRAIPVLSKSTSLRPWKVAKYTTLSYAAITMAYMVTDGDEDEERRSLEEYESGNTWIGAPRMIRMPYSDEYGNPVFLDVRRWIPAGDVFDMNQGHSALPIPAPLQFGGPLMLGAEFALNRQAFTGREITNDRTDDWWDKTSKTADWAWKSWMPSAAWIPGSWYWERIGRAMTGGRDPQGRPYTLSNAIPSSFGIKLKPQDVEESFYWKGVEFDRIERELRSEMRRLGRDYQRGMLSQSAYERREARIIEKMENLGEERRETFEPSQ